MKKIAILLGLLVLLSLLNISLLSAQEEASPITVEMVYFYGQGCPHCAKMEGFVEELEIKYPTLIIHKYEVYADQAGREMFQKLTDAHGTKISGVPTTYINGNMIVGFSDALGKQIEQEIRHCIEFGCESPLDRLEKKDDTTTLTCEGDKSPIEDPHISDTKRTLTLGAVITGALVDSINPCEFAVLILLLTAILAAGNRKRALFAGFAFTAAIYISYYLMGLGLFSAIQASGFTHMFYGIVAGLAIIVGLFNLKDYLWYGKWFVMEVPLSWRPKMKMLIKSITSVPGAFLIGFVVSLFLLPCTSGPYIVILGLLAKTVTHNYALILLLLYNLIFVMPMIIITLLVYFGFTTTEQAEHWRTTKLRTLHLITGIVMLIIGFVMIGAILLGYV